MSVQLRRATAEEFGPWRERGEAEYAGHIGASGAMSGEAAARKARDDYARLLPGGLDSPGQLIYRVVDDGQQVGWLWLAAAPPELGPSMAWVYKVEVDDEFRGRGYGRAAMLLAEDAARAHGMQSLGLNVHGGNTVGRSLYDSMGYQVTSQQMKKDL